MTFRLLSQRTSPDPAFDGPYDGLPPWLFQSVAAWLNSIVYSGPSGPNEALLRDAEVVLHLDPPLNWLVGGHSAISTVLNRMQTDGDFALDFLDYLLSTPWTDAPTCRKAGSDTHSRRIFMGGPFC